jgi:phosphate transport system permease protein
VRSDEPPSASGAESGFPTLSFSSADPGTPEAPTSPDLPPVSRRPAPRKRSLRSRLSGSDLVFRGILRGGGGFVLVLELLVGGFLFYQANVALKKVGWSFITTQEWNPNSGVFGIAAIMTGTLLIAVVAVLVAVPLALGAALYIAEYSPLRFRRFLTALIDLMAAIPSVVFGLWGSHLLQWKMISLSKWINDWLFWIPIFKVNGVTRGDPLTPDTAFSASTFIAGVVVSLMIVPIACSIMREAFSQAPLGEREGAYALGATRWGMIRAVVLPFGRGAMIGGTMLGLGRALGETIAVVLIISPVYQIQPQILSKGASSISATIALLYSESTPFGISALMAAGLALFVMTLVVNFIAAQIVSRSRSGAVSDA